MQSQFKENMAMAAAALGQLDATLNLDPIFPSVTIIHRGMPRQFYAPEEELNSYYDAYKDTSYKCYKEAEETSDDDPEYYSHVSGRTFDTLKELWCEHARKDEDLRNKYRWASRLPLPDRRLELYDGESGAFFPENQTKTALGAKP